MMHVFYLCLLELSISWANLTVKKSVVTLSNYIHPILFMCHSTSQLSELYVEEKMSKQSHMS